MTSTRGLDVAIIGAGLIGLDLLEKVQDSAVLQCAIVAGRNTESLGLRRAREIGCTVAAVGGRALLDPSRNIDVVFDASNAEAHAEHQAIAREIGALLIDLTPTDSGSMIVPSVNLADVKHTRHVNLISCGAQAAIPVLHAIARQHNLTYVEVVTTGASHSAGRATRQNLDEYIAATEEALRRFSGSPEAKVLVNISPAKPAPPFRVSLSAIFEEVPSDLTEAWRDIDAILQVVQRTTPGYAIRSHEYNVVEQRLTINIEVSVTQGRIPRYAGNLHIINAAAILAAETIADASP